MRRGFVAVVIAVGGLAALPAAGLSAPPQPDPAGLIDLPPGFQYDVLATSGVTPVESIENGQTYPMPEDFDANIVVPRPDGGAWLVSGHELTQPREGDFQGDAGKTAIPELATTDDGDSDGWGSVTRMRLTPNGRQATDAKVITTGLHNLCAGAMTPWGTVLVNEEFPFIVDPERRSGWVWEVDPQTGEQTKLTGMGRYSHEQEALAGDGAWYLTDDRGDWRFNYRFVPNDPQDLTTGQLYGLVFDRSTGTGTWVGPLDVNDPHADMVTRGYDPTQVGFLKGEGIVAHPNGNSLAFSESGAGSNPGRVWRFFDLTPTGLRGEVLVEGDFAQLSRPDNLRYTPARDLLVLEDNGSALANPATGGRNEAYILERGRKGADDLHLFGAAGAGYEPTGPWFYRDGRILFLSLQGDPSHVLGIRGPRGFSFSEPYTG